MTSNRVSARSSDLDKLGTPIIASIIIATIAINVVVGIMWFFYKTDRSHLSEKTEELAEPSPEFPSVPFSPPYPSSKTQFHTTTQHHENAQMGPTDSQGGHRLRHVHWNRTQVPLLPTEQPVPVTVMAPFLTTPNLQRGPSVCSNDSASVYSSASAPLEFHERMYQPLTLASVSPLQVTMPDTTARVSRADHNEDSHWSILPVNSQIIPTISIHLDGEQVPALTSVPLSQSLPLNIKPCLPSLPAPIAAHLPNHPNTRHRSLPAAPAIPVLSAPYPPTPIGLPNGSLDPQPRPIIPPRSPLRGIPQRQRY